ncbi:Hypothetical predicted protein [Paramuricea clavata]|uniref:Uncharacterized protein n=1 Tax=Paramuricea clavata TaxID=317549 RepID=A0A7D9L748_PARCT|nr:Hypothetical predicted protein [Paramuricea clavata]
MTFKCICHYLGESNIAMIYSEARNCGKSLSLQLFAYLQGATVSHPIIIAGGNETTSEMSLNLMIRAVSSTTLVSLFDDPKMTASLSEYLYQLQGGLTQGSLKRGIHTPKGTTLFTSNTLESDRLEGRILRFDFAKDPNHSSENESRLVDFVKGNKGLIVAWGMRMKAIWPEGSTCRGQSTHPDKRYAVLGTRSKSMEGSNGNSLSCLYNELDDGEQPDEEYNPVHVSDVSREDLGCLRHVEKEVKALVAGFFSRRPVDATPPRPVLPDFEIATAVCAPLVTAKAGGSSKLKEKCSENASEGESNIAMIYSEARNCGKLLSLQLFAYLQGATVPHPIIIAGGNETTSEMSLNLMIRAVSSTTLVSLFDDPKITASLSEYLYQIQGRRPVDATFPRPVLPDFEIATAIHATADLSPSTADVIQSLGGNRSTALVLKRLQRSIIVRIREEDLKDKIFLQVAPLTWINPYVRVTPSGADEWIPGFAIRKTAFDKLDVLWSDVRCAFGQTVNVQRSVGFAKNRSATLAHLRSKRVTCITTGQGIKIPRAALDQLFLDWIDYDKQLHKSPGAEKNPPGSRRKKQSPPNLGEDDAPTNCGCVRFGQRGRTQQSVPILILQAMAKMTNPQIVAAYVLFTENDHSSPYPDHYKTLQDITSYGEDERCRDCITICNTSKGCSYHTCTYGIIKIHK